LNINVSVVEMFPKLLLLLLLFVDLPSGAT
jgi:hypothetical protein